MLSVPWGYSVEAITTWEDTPGSGTSVQDLIYITGIYTCDTFDLGLYGGISSFTSDCGVDDNYGSSWGGTPTMSGDSASTIGTDVGGQDIFIQIYCWDCGWYSNPQITEYDLTIRVLLPMVEREITVLQLRAPQLLIRLFIPAITHLLLQLSASNNRI